MANQIVDDRYKKDGQPTILEAHQKHSMLRWAKIPR